MQSCHWLRSLLLIPPEHQTDGNREREGAGLPGSYESEQREQRSLSAFEPHLSCSSHDSDCFMETQPSDRGISKLLFFVLQMSVIFV